MSRWFYEDERVDGEYDEWEIYAQASARTWGAIFAKVAMHQARQYGKGLQGLQVLAQQLDEAASATKGPVLQIGTHLHFSMEKLAKAFKPISDTLVPKMDQINPLVKPGHSMTPPKNRHFDRRGRKRQ